MKRTPSTQRPQAVLFACGLNSVRSPMAAALLRQALGTSLYVASAGVRKGELDVFAAAVMDESGIDIKAHRPMTFEELDDLEGLNFDLIVTLSPKRTTRRSSSRVRSRPTSNIGPPPIPTAIEGSREQRMNAYRDVRDQLLQRIRTRFFSAPERQ
jgi:Protein-tyrosine-phosphatase